MDEKKEFIPGDVKEDFNDQPISTNIDHDRCLSIAFPEHQPRRGALTTIETSDTLEDDVFDEADYTQFENDSVETYSTHKRKKMEIKAEADKGPKEYGHICDASQTFRSSDSNQVRRENELVDSGSFMDADQSKELNTDYLREDIWAQVDDNLPVNMEIGSSSNRGNFEIITDSDSIEEHLAIKNIPNKVDGNIYSIDIEDAASNNDAFYHSILDDSLPSESVNQESIFVKLHTFLEKPDLLNVVEEPLNKSVGEIVMMLLQFALTYALSQTAVTHLFQFLNCLFVSPILPDSRYLIDQLFNPSKNATFHGLCPECGRYIGIFERSSALLNCDVCNIEIETNTLSYNDFFVNFDVSSQISELVTSNSDYYTHVMKERITQKNVFRDIYDGRLYQEFLAYLKPCERQKYLSVNFNSDGAPLFQSSSYSIWPIYLQINELPFHIRSSELIIVGLWFGKTKPNMDIFLDPFVENINKLSSTGVKCMINNEEVNIKVYPIICCVDSVARAPMQGMTQYNGKFGCPWCLHPGRWVSNPLNPKSGSHKYPLTTEIINLRNVNDTITHMEKATALNTCVGVKGPSPLIRLRNFNIIEGFTPDPLHIFTGIGKQFTNTWFGIKGKFSGFVPREKIDEVNCFMKNLKVPCQIGRLCRTLDDRAFWKAREWENFILYYSIPIIQLTLNKKFIEHWLLLVEAFYILLKERITLSEIDHADFLLHQFVANTELLYSDMQMTFNVHQLLHLAKSVLNWGPLWAHSTYGFESGNGDLLDIIHAAKGVHHQVCRHIGFKFSLITVKRKIYEQSSLSTKNFIEQLSNKRVKKL